MNINLIYDSNKIKVRLMQKIIIFILQINNFEKIKK